MKPPRHFCSACLHSVTGTGYGKRGCYEKKKINDQPAFTICPDKAVECWEYKEREDGNRG